VPFVGGGIFDQEKGPKERLVAGALVDDRPR